tara:strand:+ start:160 stop:456 length:297 start_codon:yes stop_codon:yes gene_type:complete
MATKKNNKYQVTLQETELKDGTAPNQSITFDIENHDNLMEIISISKDRSWFENNRQNIEFIVGLKLLGEVAIRNRKNPLFEEFLPALGELVKKIKDTN